MANQLYSKGQLNYYARRTGQEIDFILNQNTAIEIKETPSQGDLKILNRRASAINISNTALIGRHSPPGDFDNFVWGGAVY